MQAPLNERLILFVKSLPQFSGRSTDTQIADFLHIHKQVYHNIKKGERSIPMTVITDLVTNHGLNANWWATGQGDMMLGADDVSAKKLQSTQPMLAPYSQSDHSVVPLYSSLNNIAGLPTGQIDTTTQIGSLMVSNVRADCAIVVSGDSMQPRFLPGDYVLLRAAQPDFIEYGQPYVVELASMDVVLKLLKPNDDTNYLSLQSENAAYPDLPVMRKQITRLYRVVGLFRKEVIQ